MKSRLRTATKGDQQYSALMFSCPGCALAEPHYGIHVLPVNTSLATSWDWNGNLELPTLRPSILTTSGGVRCHSFLTDGVFEFLSDCQHALAGQSCPMPDLPEWTTKENE